jgi:potassium-dependent mechanosensitive channel
MEVKRIKNLCASVPLWLKKSTNPFLNRFCLLLCIIFSPPSLFSSPALLEDMGFSTPSHTEVVEVPNPGSLNPQWWRYFEVDKPELTQRVAAVQQQLQMQIRSLPLDSQESASTLFNQWIVNMNALIGAKKVLPKEIPLPPPIRQTYTIEQQLELNHKIRKLKVEKKNESDEQESVKSRIGKAQKHLDELLIAYLSMETSPKKYLMGLELMAQRAGISMAEENLRLNQSRMDVLQAKIGQLQKELEASKQLLNVSSYNEHQLEHDIQIAQTQLENAKAEFAKAEANSLNFLSDSASDRSYKYLLSQKVVHASINKAYAWTSLAYNKLKYNLIMHLNNRFEESHSEMRQRLTAWKDNLDALSKQLSDWKKSSLKEQDRVRLDYAFLATQTDNAEATKLMRFNQSRRQESLDSLSALQLLDDEISNMKWLIERLEDYIQLNSSFIAKGWMGLTAFISASWTLMISWLNYSLFKINGIPITLVTLLRIAIILGITYVLSKVVRSALISFGQSQGNFTDSTLYTLGRLSHYFILSLGGLIAVFSIGLDFSNLVIITGALTFGIGFGLQSLATNFFCGLRILFERKLKIGDYIELESGLYGKISEIHVQNTVICTSDGREVIVPNSELIGHQLINWTMNNDYRRLHIPFQISYNNDKEFVRKIISQAAKRVPCTLMDTEYGDPQVWLVKFGEHALEFELVVWVNYKTKSFTDSKEADYLWEIETALKEYKIELPLAQQLVYFKQLNNNQKDNGPGAHHPPFLETSKQEKKIHGEIGVVPTRHLS